MKLRTRWQLVGALGCLLAACGAPPSTDTTQETLRVSRTSPGQFVAGDDVWRGETPQPGARGELTLLHFWAPWCPPCRKELPAFLSLGAQVGPGLRVLALAEESDWEKVTAFFGTEAPPEVALDRSGALRRSVGVREYPETFLVDAHGQLWLRFRGPHAWTSPAALALLRTLAAPVPRRHHAK